MASSLFSAVDVHVAKSILQDCLMGYKKNATIILSTHAIHFLKHMDYIYILEKGEIVERGDFALIQSGKRFQKLKENFMEDTVVEADAAAAEEKEENKNNTAKQN